MFVRPEVGTFLSGIRDGVNLSDTERRICCMARMNIPPLGMATILKRSKAAISLARSRMYRKLHGTPGTGQMFDAFIREL